MNNLIALLDQSVIAVFSIVIMYYSFKCLNNCTKSTKIFIRIPLIMYLAGSVGTLLLMASGATIDWAYGLFIVATTLHLASERRNNFNQIFPSQNMPQGKH